jgi:hypothetical protein
MRCRGGVVVSSGVRRAERTQEERPLVIRVQPHHAAHQLHRAQRVAEELDTAGEVAEWRQLLQRAREDLGVAPVQGVEAEQRRVAGWRRRHRQWRAAPSASCPASSAAFFFPAEFDSVFDSRGARGGKLQYCIGGYCTYILT